MFDAVLVAGFQPGCCFCDVAFINLDESESCSEVLSHVEIAAMQEQMAASSQLERLQSSPRLGEVLSPMLF